MNYKELFKRTILLISSPAKAWEEIGVEADRRRVLSTFVYPMIALCGLSVFTGSLLETGIELQSFQIAMTKCCAVFVSLFGGYFLAAYIINRLGISMFKMDDDILLLQQFVGYAMVVTYLLSIVVGIFPGFYILCWIFQFYVVYVVWEGARVLLHVEEQKQMAYTVMASLLIIICPALLEIIFDQLSFILS